MTLTATRDPVNVLLGRKHRSEKFSYPLAGNQFGLDSAAGDFTLDERAMSVWVPFADGRSRDGVGDLLEVEGIRTDRHRQNPIVLFDHGKEVSLPIALAEDRNTKQYTVEIDPINRTARLNAFFYQGTGLKGVERDREKDHAVFCEQLYDLVAQRFLRAGSIGYQVIHAKQLYPDYETGTPKGLHLLSVLMLEGSIVVLPANGDTVRKMLALPNVCGKRLSPYLVKSLAPYAVPKKVQIGYEGRKVETILDVRKKYLQKATRRAGPEMVPNRYDSDQDPIKAGDKVIARSALFTNSSPAKQVAKAGDSLTVASAGEGGGYVVENGEGLRTTVRVGDLRKRTPKRDPKVPVRDTYAHAQGKKPADDRPKPPSQSPHAIADDQPKPHKKPEEQGDKTNYFHSCQRDELGHCKELTRLRKKYLKGVKSVEQPTNSGDGFHKAMPDEETPPEETMGGENTPPPPENTAPADEVPPTDEAPPPDEPLPEEAPVEEDKGLDEPFGAQVLRRRHEHLGQLLSEYDGMLRHLEKEEVRSFLTEDLKYYAGRMGKLEKLWKKAYKDLEPLTGMADAKDMDTMDDPAVPTAGTDDSEPGDEEAPPEEGQKGLKKKTKAAAVSAKKAMCSGCGKEDCSCQGKQGQKLAPVAAALVGGAASGVASGVVRSALGDKGMRSVAEASKFCKELSEAKNFGDEQRMKSYHYHKTLADLAPAKALTQDEAAAVGDRLDAETRDTEDGPDLKRLGQASAFFKELSGTRDFGDAHRRKSASWHKVLDEISAESPEEAIEEDDAIGEIGEKSILSIREELDKQNKQMEELFALTKKLEKVGA